MLEEVKRLVQKLLANEITWEEALQAYYDQGDPWRSKFWKEKRQEIIGSSCEQCGSEEPPFVLQHLKKYPGFADCKRIIQEPLWEQYKAEHPVEKPALPVVLREACPKCQSTSIKFQKTVNRWKCYGKQRRRTCNHEFEQPIQVEGHTAQARRDRSVQWQEDSRQNWESFQALYRDRIGKEAILLTLRYRMLYLSFKDVATFCKKCAYIWDMKGERLCQQCKTNWHHIALPVCSACRENNRALDQIQGT